MHLRLILGSLLLLGVSTTAQIPAPAPAPTPTPAPPPAQDPDKPEPTPAEVIAELAKEKARLEKEIQYVQERAKNSKAMLSNKLRSPVQAYRAIDAGVSQTAPRPAPVPRYARVAAGEEMASLPQDVMLTVNGRPISRSVFDQVMVHMRTAPGGEDDNLRAQRVLYDLVVTEAMSAIFAETEAEGILGDVLTELDKGKSMQDLAKAIGSVPGSIEGRLEVTRHSAYGPRFEQIAFDTKDGQRARPFRNAHGIVVLFVERHEKGASPELDKVIGTAIQIPHSSDAATTAKAQQSINMAQVDIVVRDAEVMAMLPQLWKQPAPAVAPSAAGDVAGLRETLTRLQAEIDKLSASTEDVAKERVKVLQTQYIQVKEALKRAELASVQAADDGTEKPKKEEPAPKKN